MKKPGTLILKKDNLKLGILLGFLLPLLVIILLYSLKFSSYPVADFLKVVGEETRLITFFAAWSLVANIGLFTYFINTEKFQTSKGIFVVTIIYGVLFLLIRFIG